MQSAREPASDVRSWFAVRKRSAWTSRESRNVCPSRLLLSSTSMRCDRRRVMLRPTSFQQAQVVFQDVPYEVCDPVRQRSLRGVLCRGDLVWTQESQSQNMDDHTTRGFVDGVGIVSLDTESLIPANVLNEREVKRARHSPVRTPTHAEIERLAYSLWEDRPENNGNAVDDWLRAEKELTSSHSGTTTVRS